MEPECIRKFLHLCDQYVNEVVACSRQLRIDADETDAIQPVHLKFWVNIEFLQSTIALGLIDGATDYKSLSYETPRSYLNTKASDQLEVTTLSSLDTLV